MPFKEILINKALDLKSVIRSKVIFSNLIEKSGNGKLRLKISDLKKQLSFLNTDIKSNNNIISLKT